MFSNYEIIYEDETGIEIIGEFSGNGNGYTVDEALRIADVDMDQYAEQHDWDGYDWNCLSIRFKV
jgi:hypothetical protein